MAKLLEGQNEKHRLRYRPADRLPVWHTDGTFKETPDAGSFDSI